MMLDFIQNKLFSNYQLPKSMLPPVYRPSPKANSTHNQPEQQNNNNNNSRNQGFNTAASPVKNNPFQLTTGAIGVTTPLPTEDDGITPLSGINSIARTEAVLSKSITNNNPFLLAQTDPAKQLEQLGQNRPFNKPIFLGYRDNIALYGASKLFVLC